MIREKKQPTITVNIAVCHIIIHDNSGSDIILGFQSELMFFFFLDNNIKNDHCEIQYNA